MKALQKTAPAFGLEWRDVPSPTVEAPDDVIVEVAAAGVCGSDLHIYDWSGGYDFVTPAMPVTIGHEFAGVVVAGGRDAFRTLALGQRVVVIPSVECNACGHCMAGRPDDCQDRRGIGMLRDGAFAPFVKVPARNCLPLPDGFDLSIAALCEPLSIALSAVETGDLRVDDKVLVLGPGSIGQAIALLAEERGAQVVVAGYDDAQRLAGVRALGIERTVDLKYQSPRDAAALAGTDAFDIVIDAAGVQSAVDSGLTVLRASGVMVLCGIHANRVTFDGARFVRMRHQIRGTYRATRQTWRNVVDFAIANEARLAPLISHRLPLHEALQSFELAKSKVSGKVMLIP
ncbi:zinc-dependent alcohol dehydrogenase [Burkholderia cepacia]|uniref:zinc-dependent alcohol dehydrogenase n=1 Tax=Burkholderia cepacia TaxID=292 RepID=UPI0007C6A1CA|nr:alcohol dehydrogenase catalytic domain-containing protein [Burkholderia cepacia]